MGRVAIYPGSFDPITYGHIDLVKRATNIFDKVIVAVARNRHKKPLFSVDERLDMVRQALSGIEKAEKLEVETFDGLAVEYARGKKAKVLIRGLRMISDFEYEFRMALTNRRLAQDVETVFLMPSEQYSFISSSLLKEAIAQGADLSTFIPPHVAKRLKEKVVPS